MMSLFELLPNVRTLSRHDKLSLIHLLTQEMRSEDGTIIEPGQAYPMWSPDDAFTAAAALLEALEEDKVQT